MGQERSGELGGGREAEDEDLFGSEWVLSWAVVKVRWF